MTEIPLEHIHGQIDHVSGWSNGIALKVDGILNLGNVSVLGQQITNVESPFHVHGGVAELESVRGRFLGGEILGEGRISLDATPSVHVCSLLLRGAQLEEYARTLSGRQKYRGNIDAKFECHGLGSDIHSLNGSGEAHITQGDLGELPFVLRFGTWLKKNLTLADIAPQPGQDRVRLGRRRLHDRSRRVDHRPDQVHRQRLQPSGPRDPRPPGQHGPPAQCSLGSRPVPHQGSERSPPRSQRPVLDGPCVGYTHVSSVPARVVPHMFKAMGQGRADRQP